MKYKSLIIDAGLICLILVVITLRMPAQIIVPLNPNSMFPFPPDCTTPLERLEFASRAKLCLMDEHGFMSRWEKEGVSRDEYDNGGRPQTPVTRPHLDHVTLPARVKARFPYKPRLTTEDVKRYQRELYNPRMKTVMHEITQAKKELEMAGWLSERWLVDLEKIKPAPNL